MVVLNEPDLRRSGRAVDAELWPEDLRVEVGMEGGGAEVGEATRLEVAEALGLGLCGLLEGRGGGGEEKGAEGRATVSGNSDVGVIFAPLTADFLLVKVLIASAVENSGMIGEGGLSLRSAVCGRRCRGRGPSDREGCSTCGERTIIQSSGEEGPRD